MPLLGGGRLKALAVLSAERLDVLPQVPTVAEAGFAGLAFNGGLCLWAPVGIAAARALLGQDAVVFGTDAPLFDARCVVRPGSTRATASA